MSYRPHHSEQKSRIVRASVEDDLYIRQLGSLLVASTQGSVVPSVAVKFDDLSIKAKGTPASATNPSVLNAAKSAIPLGWCTQVVRAGRGDNNVIKEDTNFVTVLDGATGVLQPGRLTLLLGPPGSGKSILQAALAGRLKESKGLKIHGTITYNGLDIKTLEAARITAWVKQTDVHLPKLTVLETAQFSQNCVLDREMQVRILKALLKRKKMLQEESATAMETKLVPGGGAPRQFQCATVSRTDFQTEETFTSGLIAALDKQLSNHSLDADETLEAQEQGTALDGFIGSASLETSPKAGEGGVEGIHQLAHDSVFAEAASLIAEQLIIHKLQSRLVIRLLGLRPVQDSYIGDALTRGISGGQKRRVTLAEELCTARNIVLMDQINIGLDSATTYSLVCLLSKIAKNLRKAVLVSMLQPQAESFEKFDDVMLMFEGKVLYHGPRDKIIEYFEEFGFKLPDRKGPAAFLLELCTAPGQLTFATPALLKVHGLTEEHRTPENMLKNPPKKLLVPAIQMFEAFKEKRHKMTQEEEGGKEQLEGPAIAAANTAVSDSTIWPPRKPFINNLAASIKLILIRQMKLEGRERGILLIRLFQIVLLGIIYGTLFDVFGNTAEVDGRNVISLCTTTVLGMSFLAVPQVSIVFSTKSVFFKHRDGKFFPPVAYVVGTVLPQYAIGAVETVIFSSLVYWIVGFYAAAAQFFTFVLILWSALVALGAQFRLVAYLATSFVGSNTTVSFLMLLAIITNGFTIIKTEIPNYVIWIYWMNPVSWAIRSLAINELRSPSFDQPSGEATEQTVGEVTLQTYGFFTESAWIWYGLAFLWGSTFVYMGCGVVALHVRNPPRERPIISTKDARKSLQWQAIAWKTNAWMSQRRIVESIPFKRSREVEGKEGGKREKLEYKAPPLISLVCKDVWYSVPHPANKGETLHLINGISFFAKPGTLTALMGGSGAGKTTLMDCILGRKTIGEIKGEILLNGKPATPGIWSNLAGYVEQFDILTAQLTVKETVEFSGRLRLNERQYTQAEVKQTVADALAMVELEDVCDRVVGSALAPSLSAEQCKRVSIAVEIVSMPAVLFLDEATSNLDVRAAGVVMRAVKNVAASGRTVVATIHQPSIEIFESFDRLLLLRRGGMVDYFGEVGDHSRNVISYFQDFSGVPPIAPSYNPASWMLEVTGAAASTVFTSTDADFANEYSHSKLHEENMVEMANIISEGGKLGVADAGMRLTSSATQRKQLIKKYWLIYWRSPNYNFIRIVMTVAIALVYGLIFLNKADFGSIASVASIQSISGVIFSMANFLGIFNTLNVQPIVSQERSVFYKEHAIGMYGPGSLAIASALVEIPFLLMQGLIMSAVSYWMVGFEAVAWKFFYFMLLFTLSITMSCFLGQFLVYATPTPVLAQLLATMTTQLMVLFCGFLVPYPTMPQGWQWLNRILPTTWTMYGIMASQTGDSSVPMEPNSVPGNPSIGTVSEYVNWLFGYEYSFIWWCPLILFAYCLFLRVATALMLKYVSFLKR